MISYDALRLFEYHPLLSNRAHKFMNDKQKILNKEFKQTYTDFLLYLVVGTEIRGAPHPGPDVLSATAGAHR